MRSKHIYFCLALMLCISPGQLQTCLDYADDPCDSSNYIELNDPTRSSTYEDASAATEDDYSLVSGWYRSISQSGGDMPTSPPEVFKCQAFSPIWLNGTLPAFGEGIVSRTVCARRYANTCNREYLICIKNCGNFNVYYLQTPDTSTERYCFDPRMSTITDTSSMKPETTSSIPSTAVQNKQTTGAIPTTVVSSAIETEITSNIPSTTVKDKETNQAMPTAVVSSAMETETTSMIPSTIVEGKQTTEAMFTTIASPTTSLSTERDMTSIDISSSESIHTTGVAISTSRAHEESSTTDGDIFSQASNQNEGTTSTTDTNDMHQSETPIISTDYIQGMKEEDATSTRNFVHISDTTYTRLFPGQGVTQTGQTSKGDVTGTMDYTGMLNDHMTRKGSTTSAERTDNYSPQTDSKETLLIAVIVALVAVLCLAGVGVIVYCIIKHNRKISGQRKELETIDHDFKPGVLEENFYHDINVENGKMSHYEELRQTESNIYDKLGDTDDYMTPTSFGIVNTCQLTVEETKKTDH